MHVMFIHPNFPAQFGDVARRLAIDLGWTCSFVTSVDTSHLELPIVRISYRVKGKSLEKTFFNEGGLESRLDHLEAIYRGLRKHPEIRPDVVVGHMYFGTMLYLRTLYDCPFVGYFELLPPPFWSAELALRAEYPPSDEARLAVATAHTLTYLHLHSADACYTPTHFQKSTAPVELQEKIRVIFDGVDTNKFRPQAVPRPTTFQGVEIPAGAKIVTYVSRGLEAIRGFDIFMQVAKNICAERDDVHFLIAGQDRTCYGHELSHIEEASFKEHVLARGGFDLDRFHFLGLIPTSVLPTLFNLSDLHIYLTVPYVLSWSLVQAMSNGCTLLASDTSPVQEVIDHNVHGLLADFSDVDALTRLGLQVLERPDDSAELGRNARQRVLERYDQTVCLEQQADFFRSLVS